MDLITVTSEDLAVRGKFNVREVMVECMFWDQLLLPQAVDTNARASKHNLTNQTTYNIGPREEMRLMS